MLGTVCVSASKPVTVFSFASAQVPGPERVERPVGGVP